MNKRDNILSVALKLFVESGEQATSMKLIAQKSNSGIGTMYNYFSSKEQLMKELYIETKKELFDFVFSDFNYKQSTKKQYVTAWLKVIDWYLKNREKHLYSVMYSHVCKFDKKEKKKFENSFIPIYENGKKEGVIKNIETSLLLMTNNGAISNCILVTPLLCEKEKENIVKMAWDAIKS